MKCLTLSTLLGLLLMNSMFATQKNNSIESAQMKDTIFREYDIRGKVNDELVVDEVYNLARAIAYYFKQLNPNVKTIAVGRDGRTHSPQIKENLCAGLMDSGLDVIFVGVGPSPLLYFALHNLEVDGGLMITASHNPKEYNGIKVCFGTESLFGDQIRKIGALYREKKFISTEKKGTYSENLLHNAYVDWHVQQFSHLKNIDMSMVIDSGNGAAGAVVPQLVEKLGWKNAYLLHQEVDGTFPNHEADPIVEKNMQDVKHALQTTDAIVGIGFDGDADRMGAMTKQGQLVTGDKLLALFAQPMIKKHPGMAVVYNVICSAGLGEVLEQWGAQSCISPVGHSLIEEKMNECNALLGGETSCHFYFRDRHFGYDDGIYAMLRLVEILVESQKDLQELLKVFPKKVTSPEFRIPCSEEEKWNIVENVKKWFEQQQGVELLTIDGVRATMDYGWGILRASNTQPVLSMRFESDTKEGLQKVKEDFIKALTPYFDITDLRTQLHM